MNNQNDVNSRLKQNPQLRKAATTLLWSIIVLLYFLLVS
jgi:hypothetical protein